MPATAAVKNAVNMAKRSLINDFTSIGARAVGNKKAIVTSKLPDTKLINFMPITDRINMSITTVNADCLSSLSFLHLDTCINTSHIQSPIKRINPKIGFKED